MPNALTYWAIRARQLLSHVFEYWLWQCRYFLSKVNINCARATAFIFDTWTGVLMKVSKFLRQKMSWPEVDSNPQVNIWNVNCARATAFIFYKWTDVLVKVSKVLRQKMSRPKGVLEPPTFGFMPNALTYWAFRAKHLLPHVFDYWLWQCRYF